MNKVFRFFALMLAALVLTALALPAFADVIIEPRSSFYDKHSNECRHTERRKYTPKDGSVEIFEEPGGKVKYTLGSELFGSQWQYTDGKGNVWCYLEDYSEESRDGWFKMADVDRLYDHIDFAEEHSKEFYEDSSEYDLTNAALYEYPNGYIKYKDWGSYYTQNFEEGGVPYTSCWRDENGRAWGAVGYYFGHWDGWICLDEPTNTSLAAESIPVFDTTTGKTEKSVPAAELFAAADNIVDNTEDNISDDDNSADDAAKEGQPRTTLSPDVSPVTFEEQFRDKTRETKGNKTWIIVGVCAAALLAGAGACALAYKKPKERG